MANSAKGSATLPAKAKRQNVDKKTFVKAVMDAISNGLGVEEVARTTGLKVGSVQARCSNYRSKGTHLPHFPRGGAKLDVAELNKFIDELTAAQKTEQASA